MTMTRVVDEGGRDTTTHGEAQALQKPRARLCI